MHPSSKRALDDAFPDLYEEVRSIAEAALRGEKSGHTLQPTALAHEAYLRLSQQDSEKWGRRAYFLSAAAGVIRRVLVDHARTRERVKRGRGWARTALDDLEVSASRRWDVLDLDEAISELGTLNDRHAHVVLLRFFGGLGNSEIAGTLGVSTRTINTDWRVARAWLRARLGADIDEAPLG